MLTLVILGALLTILSGVLHGHLRNRWGTPSKMLTAAERLRSIPAEFNGWKLQESEALSTDAVSMLECHGYINRVYVHEATGDVVLATLLMGPAGPLSVHTPEICYSSRSFELQSPRELVRVPHPIGSGVGDAAFWGLTMRSRDLEARTLRIYYGWSDGARWVAPEQPRFTLAARPYLYKLQVASFIAPHLLDESTDPCREFMRHFLPAAQQHLHQTSW